MQTAIERQEHYAPNGVTGGWNYGGYSLRVKIIDYKTGESSDYNVKNFMEMIKRDEQLFQEYSNIKTTRKKKQMMFIYLRRFNKRNPIYIYKNTYN